MAIHSKLGASSMHRWASCPGSVKLSEGIASVPSAYAEEGTRAHEVASDCLIKGLDVPVEYEDSVGIYVNAIRAERGPKDALHIEHRFSLEKVYPGMFGTADAVIYKTEEKVLQVWDYKHGAGIFVEVDHNEQLMYYGLGALLSFDYKPEKVELIICQPRIENAEPIRKFSFETIDLLEFRADLIAAAKRTNEPDAPLVTGSHCRFCPAAHICPALSAQAIESAREDFAPETYSLKQISEFLDKIPLIETWISAVREYAYRTADSGHKVPGYKLVAKRATRKWIDEDKTFKKIKLMSVDELIEESIKSPAQAEKILGKAKFNSMLGNDVVSLSSGLTLVAETDARQEVEKDKLEFTPIVDQEITH